MCNPRRVEICLTRNLAEAWQQEVRRQASLATEVVGEARILESLDTTLSSNARRALQLALRRGVPGWEQDGEGWRHEFDGGYLRYLPDQVALEIVATRCDQVTVEASASQTFSGTLNEELAVQATGNYYDDGYGGRTEEVAAAEANNQANRQLDQLAQTRLEHARRAAESDGSALVEALAQENARQALEVQAEQRRQELALAAQAQLESTGVRARTIFHQLVGLAYRDALLAYARQHGASDISCNETNGVLEIQFRYSS